MIVKIQRPIFSTSAADSQTLFVYNEDRTFEEMLPATPRLLAFMGDDYKVYARAHLHKKELVIDQRIADQPW